jgi:hypothetical protein
LIDREGFVRRADRHGILQFDVMSELRELNSQ